MRAPEYLSDAVRAADELRQVLDSVAAALAAARLPDLLDAEPRLAAALARVGRLSAAPPEDQFALSREVARAAATLRRCRTLGANLAGLTAAAQTAACGGTAYGRAGLAQALSAPSMPRFEVNF